MKKLARDALLSLKWGPEGLYQVTVHYTNRGSPEDTAHRDGSSISNLGRSFIVTKDGTTIPYHRVKRIEKDNLTYWIRKREGHPDRRPSSTG